MVTYGYRNDLMKIPKATQPFMPFIKHDLKNENEQNKLNFNSVLTLSKKMFCPHRSTVKDINAILYCNVSPVNVLQSL